MFDEPTQPTGQPAGQPGAEQAKSVEDIFAATDKAPSSTPSSAIGGGGPAASSPAPGPLGAPSAASGGTPPLGPPSALSQGRLQPAAASGGATVPSAQLSGVSGLSSHAKRLILMVGGGVVVAAGLFVAWRLWRGGGDEGGVVAPVNPVETGRGVIEKGGEAIGNTLQNIQQNSMDKALNPFEQNTSSGAGSADAGQAAATTTEGASTSASADNNSSDDKTDTDQDGLPDSEEAALGTNVRLVDSDGDGLSDWEEVKVWDTKPLVPDTDNDTYPDGHEVQNGYNPKGAGKLLDFEKAKQKAQ